jgi:GNAT superfamily N-acetyltransferase
MSGDRISSIADTYWAAHLGCRPRELFVRPFHLATHGVDLAGYNGVQALFRNGCVCASIPPERETGIIPLLGHVRGGCSPDQLISALRPVASLVLGPAFVGYAETLPLPSPGARSLSAKDEDSVKALEYARGPAEWGHGGSPLTHPCSGVFVGEQLAALAGFEVWGGTIAHISIVTHPAFRSRGLGRDAVAHLAQRAIRAGLLPQYRTLDSNTPSIRVAASLGFQRYATSVAVRLR